MNYITLQHHIKTADTRSIYEQKSKIDYMLSDSGVHNKPQIVYKLSEISELLQIEVDKRILLDITSCLNGD